MTVEAVILADLAARYPQGFVSFTRGGKRTTAANIYPAKIGYTVNINGISHVYGHDGRLISAGHEHNWIGHTFVRRHA